ncbi:hypothetical protein NO2_1488, partial [Candidatus Termititenax persephonae]
MIMQTKTIAEPKHLTFARRWRLHARRPELPLYTAQPFDDILSDPHERSNNFKLINESFGRTVSFSPANLPVFLTHFLKKFKPRDGYHANGLQFI